MRFGPSGNVYGPRSMRAVWPTLVEPLLSAGRPKRIADLDHGGEPLGDLLEEALRELGAELVEPGEAPDLALVHGQPNWHSVTEALELLGDNGAPMALTLVHGADWPTARRDAYPEPEAIPAGSRQPHRPVAGVERALDEHDIRNGVMTAVEDFARTRGDLEVLHVPGLGGTAVLVSSARLEGEDGRALAELLAALRLSPEALAQFAAVEAERVRAEEDAAALAEEIESLRAGASAQASAETERLRERIDELASREAELTEALARRSAHLGAPVPPIGVELAARTRHSSATLLEVEPGPLPRDRRRILVGPDDSGEEGGPPLEVVVRMKGGREELARCLWSILDRACRPIRLFLDVPDDADAEARALAESLLAAEPLVSPAPEAHGETPGEGWVLRVDEPVEVAHGTFANLLAAGEEDSGLAPLAAISADSIGVPEWAGTDSAGLMLGGRTIDADSAPEHRAACVLSRDRSARSEARTLVLDAAVRDGAAPGPPLDEPEWLADAYGGEGRLGRRIREQLAEPLSIAYVLPGLPPEGSGGSHSIFQEALALRAFGARVRVMVAAEHAKRAEQLYPEATELVHPYRSPSALASGLAGIDVVVATEAPSAQVVQEHARANAGVLGAYYVQDYEPLFSPAGGPSADAALLSYRHAEGLLLYAKTHWIANVVDAAHGLAVAKVRPSLDRSVFHAHDRREEREPMRVLAMIRPRTPRRRAAETMAALDRIGRELGERVECLTFGCPRAELDRLPAAEAVEHLGTLARQDVAEVLRRCDVFLDLSTYQAFGRTGLEAMACGAVPVLPCVGGVREYAVDGWNGVLVDTADEDAVIAEVTRLLEDAERFERMRVNGIRTSGRFSVTGAAVSQYACFAAHCRRGGGRR
jgi:glycosyltransferase involved in cell wall biosynthesis